MASRSTGGAHPSSNACFQRLAHRHHLSPALSPGKLYSNLGVVKSLPALELNVRNASSTTTQTVCTPLSVLSVLQHPSLNQPVFGSSLHVFRAVPSTLIEGSTSDSSYWIDIKCCRSSYLIRGIWGFFLDSVKKSGYPCSSNCLEERPTENGSHDGCHDDRRHVPEPELGRRAET